MNWIYLIISSKNSKSNLIDEAPRSHYTRRSIRDRLGIFSIVFSDFRGQCVFRWKRPKRQCRRIAHRVCECFCDSDQCPSWRYRVLQRQTRPPLRNATSTCASTVLFAVVTILLCVISIAIASPKWTTRIAGRPLRPPPPPWCRPSARWPPNRRKCPKWPSIWKRRWEWWETHAPRYSMMMKYTHQL